MKLLLISKLKLIFTIMLLISFAASLSPKTAFAAIIPGPGGVGCSSGGAPLVDPSQAHPTFQLLEIACVAQRVLNVMVLSSGAIFVILIAIGSTKFALAQGDPKGIQGAKNTLTYAIAGFILVIGVYALLSIIVGSLGANNSLLTPLSTLGEKMNCVLKWIETDGASSSGCM